MNEVAGSPEWALLEGKGPPPQPCTLLGELVTVHTADWRTLLPAPAGPLRKRMAHTHLCTVWEATRKDMRSPPVSCCPATREPPINRVPKTMPAREQDRWSGRGPGDRVWPLCQSLPRSPLTGVSVSHLNGLCLSSFGNKGDGGTSLLPPSSSARGSDVVLGLCAHCLPELAASSPS